MVARNKVILRGELGSEEVWSTGVHYLGSTGDVIDTQGGLQAWADGVVSAMVGVLGAGVMSESLGIGNFFTEAEVQYYPDQGGVGLSAVSPANLEGDGTGNNPYPTAVVFSLRTGVPGASFRGRNYWPAVGLALSPNGRLETDDNVAFAGAWADALQAIGQAADTGGAEMTPRIYSPTRDLLTVVSSVLVGNVPDTQRRRRDALVESYASVVYPPAP